MRSCHQFRRWWFPLTKSLRLQLTSSREGSQLSKEARVRWPWLQGRPHQPTPCWPSQGWERKLLQPTTITVEPINFYITHLPSWEGKLNSSIRPTRAHSRERFPAEPERSMLKRLETRNSMSLTSRQSAGLRTMVDDSACGSAEKRDHHRQICHAFPATNRLQRSRPPGDHGRSPVEGSTQSMRRQGTGDE